MNMKSRFLVGDFYSVVSRCTEHLCIKFSTADHIVFKAHFPTYPVVPGFLLIDIFAYEYDVNVLEVVVAQFKNMVTPGEVIIYTADFSDGYAEVEVVKDSNTVVSRFKIKCA